MSSKPEPQKSTRKTTGTRRRTPAEKKKQDDGKSGRGTGVVSNEAVRRRSEHIANLIGDTFWLFGLMVTIYFAITLASFDMNDPAWSRSVIADESIHNLGGLFGAYFADVGYYLFGLSVWWLVLAALVWLWKSFRPLHSPDSRPYSVKLAVAGLTVLLLGSPVLEYALWQQQLGDSLPTGAGGLAAPPPVEHPGRATRVIAVSGAALLALMVAVGIRRDPYAVVADKLAQPSAALPLGADSLGRDVLARVAHGAVSTVSGAVVVTVVCFVIAMLVGLAPRAATGFIEVANAAPPILAGLIVAGVSGPSATGAAIAVACVGWAPLASHAAGLVAENRQRPDVLLAPVLGEGRVRITLTRVLPAVVGPLARHAALRLPGKALALAALGFLGLGAQSPAPEWGLVLSDALPYIERAPWAVATPAAALVVLSITSVAASRSMRR